MVKAVSLVLVILLAVYALVWIPLVLMGLFDPEPVLRWLALASFSGFAYYFIGFKLKGVGLKKGREGAK